MYKYTCMDECEIYGGLLQQLHTHINKQNVISLVEDSGLGIINKDQWYPLQKLFDVFNKVNEQDGAMMNFVSIGMAVAEHALLPPEMDDASTENFWKLWSEGYFYNHRHGNIGALDVEFPTQNHVRVIDTTPYPSDHIYGVIYGFTRRFNPTNASFTVRRDADMPMKEEGTDRSIFHIEIS